MKRLICLLPLILASLAWADIASDGSNVFNPDSKQVLLSTSAVTQVMNYDSFLTRSYLINPSTWTDVCISTVTASVAIATSTWVSVPPSCIFSMDGPTVPWWGAIWAIICPGPGQTTATSQTISIMRTK